MRLTIEEIDASISIDQITAVRLKTGWKIIEPGSFEVSWSRDKGLMYYLWADRGDGHGYYEQYGLITKILEVR